MLALSRYSLRYTLAVLAFFGVFLILFWPTFLWMAERFDASDSFYSHGWLIPLASAWLIWQRRETLNSVRFRASYGGLALLMACTLVYVLSTRLAVHFVSGIAMVGVVCGLVWTLWGREVFQALRAPLLFLLFMVPLPGILLITISFRLKLLATTLATQAIHLLGIPAQQAGSTIHVPGLSIIIDDTCSGLRSLISLVALATLWAAAVLPTATARWRKLTIVAASIPIALVANMVRILVLVLLSSLYGPRIAESFIHYGSGVVVFGIAVASFAGLSHLLVKPSVVIHDRRHVARRPIRRIGAPVTIAFAVLALCALAIHVGASRTGAPLLSAARDVPTTLGLWKGTALETTPRAVELLETENVALMEYRLGNEPPVWFAQVAGFGTRAAFHPPELCYVGSDFEVLEREPITILVHGARQRVMRLVIAQNGQRFEAWYWFTANGRVTPNYYQQQIWLVTDAMRQRPMSGNLVRISTALNDPLASRRRLLAFATSLETPAHHLAHHEL